MMKQLTLEQLKRKIARLPMTSTGSRRRYPDELKEAVVTLAAEYKLNGWTQASVAAELGINEAMLSCWKRDYRDSDSSPGKLRPVCVLNDDSPPQASRVLVLPNGARVEGLSLGELAALVRELT
jgi:transposase-like protein